MKPDACAILSFSLRALDHVLKLKEELPNIGLQLNPKLKLKLKLNLIQTVIICNLKLLKLHISLSCTVSGHLSKYRN